ncbi:MULTISPECIES: metal ABC transporter ATP-binding protein [Prochlorococcus]|uniref:ABC-type Mn2+/Zn2+ transport system ATPase component n=1 Tax=Prochlorococcus marinus (strain SARG / CCMP1375 / SS120) TaxID=167539 RepID=Q7VBN3_PROMA|nr:MULTISPECIES: metal ABC transporter ATP-binding protein [Prochlorococcus]AAQ00104.1 ABC-type Mn2+/Zn2+ transport system ATPase component [Prochlorococcus marinus subsp. marinus str. CCMP1375]KGG13900.1 Manganese ABC transporter [Prochlorococcus marinus str. LG]KGG19033.1 Manganese ABC transporter [Prochlorococcus marinus str. SS2]KGG23427.1 Manganese ABC transporter [Prochlorococcus marinus str. SS35]KGG32337.1 Manganese ABC transporter [Prochlorococcus marinus str. SS51]
MAVIPNKDTFVPLRIDADQVCVDYNGNLALYDASLKLQPGCICGLVGMNGAGKTTFFKALMGFVRPSRGRILINGCSVSTAQKDQAVAYVPQNEGVDCSFPVSVWDVVMMGRYGSMNFLRVPRESDHIAVFDALERVDLIDFRNRPIGALSGGQRKRAFVARAIAQRASVLLLDEPFAGVDIRTEKLMADLFLQLRQDGRSILISTHDLSHVRNFCDVVVLINKTVLAYGNTSDVFTSENLSMTFGGMKSDPISGPISSDE